MLKALPWGTPRCPFGAALMQAQVPDGSRMHGVLVAWASAFEQTREIQRAYESAGARLHGRRRERISGLLLRGPAPRCPA